jgi:hypothetical protein
MNSARSPGWEHRSAKAIIGASREYPEPRRRRPLGLILFRTVTPFPSNESLVPCGSTTLWSRAVPFSHGLPGERRLIDNSDLIWRSLSTTISVGRPERRGVRRSTNNSLRHRRGHMTHAGLAVMAVTTSLGPARNSITERLLRAPDSVSGRLPPPCIERSSHPRSYRWTRSLESPRRRNRQGHHPEQSQA